MSPTLQDATKVLLGAGYSSDKEVSSYFGDPATFPAGTGVRLKSDGTLSVAVGDGGLLGVSLGRSLSDSKKVAVARDGNWIPLVCTLKYAVGTITITNIANLIDTTADTITVAGQAFTAQAGAATPGTATFQAATSITATRDSLLAQINAHAVVSTKVIATASSTAAITITAIAPGSAGNAFTLAYSDTHATTVGATVSGATLSGGTTVPVPGQPVYISDTTGLADVAGSGTITGGVYLTGLLTGVKEDGTTVPCCMIDMGGGL